MNKINNNLFLDNNLDLYYILIASGLILSCTLYYLIISNNTQIPATNMEPLTNENIDTIMNENMVSFTDGNVEDFITDSDFETDIESDHDTIFNSDSESSLDTESILNDPNLFFMPNVDFNVCSIEELKFFEFSCLYSKELAEHAVTDEEIMEFISYFTKEQLATN